MNNYDDPISQKVFNEALKEFKGIPYLYKQYMCGVIGCIFSSAEVPRINPINPEYFEAVIDALYVSFYGGMEPEFETEEEFNSFNETLEHIRTNLHYIRQGEQRWDNCPYRDKSIPFLAEKR